MGKLWAEQVTEMKRSNPIIRPILEGMKKSQQNWNPQKSWIRKWKIIWPNGNKKAPDKKNTMCVQKIVEYYVCQEWK